MKGRKRLTKYALRSLSITKGPIYTAYMYVGENDFFKHLTIEYPTAL